MKKLFASAAIAALVVAPLSVIGATSAYSAPTTTATEQQYVVLYASGTAAATAHAAIATAGGSIVTENTDVGVATVVTKNAKFATDAAAQSALAGTAKNRVIGDVPESRKANGDAVKFDAAEAESRVKTADVASRKSTTKTPGAEPLAYLQWDMKQIGATTTGSYKYDTGSKAVRVGIIDTGVDGTHPDIAPNFDTKLSRNFTVDIPVDANGDTIDGPCEDEPDKSCTDPANVDEDGHGTHVASTIGAPINGIGIAGVAPNVDIVNLRAGQDSGYFFLQPSLDALTYAGRNGIDVVNMSYYVDPWLFNCTNNPADSPADQQEQRTIITAMQRALDFARTHGVTLVSAAGNGATDYTKVLSDSSSPDFADVPGEIAYTRDLLDPDSCISMPSEGKGVIAVSSTGQSGRKAYYSDYGNGYVDVAAPGGDAYDTPTGDLTYAGQILAAYPKALAIANDEIDANGDPTVPYVVKSCDAKGKVCAYYQYLQGTSMASPHAVGVAALIVNHYGLPDRRTGGKTLFPAAVEVALKATATKTACPVPAEYTYVRRVPQADGSVVVRTSTATCEGTRASNGFYGKGVVNALKAVKPF
ncbi:S8 family serine peptidase [Glaciihabitans sp. dw_435]|uniref:S8 family peptidase n=1 Tax=Glaciihabitans sp. dw_435 TaxID=2720081 RepID=UPI001BD1DD9B|nr:S8 family serine peptidase [Glaciihabitans sp. dw_435]